MAVAGRARRSNGCRPDFMGRRCRNIRRVRNTFRSHNQRTKENRIITNHHKTHDAMNIKIKSITLRNFKGLRDVSFDFDGRNATIIGDNGTGKTTIFRRPDMGIVRQGFAQQHRHRHQDNRRHGRTYAPRRAFRRGGIGRGRLRTDAAPHVPRDLEQAARVVRPAIRPDTKVRLPSMAWRSEPRRHTTKSFRNGSTTMYSGC